MCRDGHGVPLLGEIGPSEEKAGVNHGGTKEYEVFLQIQVCLLFSPCCNAIERSGPARWCPDIGPEGSNAIAVRFYDDFIGDIPGYIGFDMLI